LRSILTQNRRRGRKEFTHAEIYLRVEDVTPPLLTGQRARPLSLRLAAFQYRVSVPLPGTNFSAEIESRTLERLL